MTICYILFKTSRIPFSILPSSGSTAFSRLCSYGMGQSRDVTLKTGASSQSKQLFTISEAKKHVNPPV
jgi:hypothetical protein